jgi:hypothetical protein
MRHQKVKEGLILESNKVLSKYKGSTINEDLLKRIRSELNDALNGYISNALVYNHDFPIEFENELGLWKINSNGDTFFQPKRVLSRIECNITINKIE